MLVAFIVDAQSSLKTLPEKQEGDTHICFLACYSTHKCEHAVYSRGVIFIEGEHYALLAFGSRPQLRQLIFCCTHSSIGVASFTVSTSEKTHSQVYVFEILTCSRGRGHSVCMWC